MKTTITRRAALAVLGAGAAAPLLGAGAAAGRPGWNPTRQAAGGQADPDDVPLHYRSLREVARRIRGARDLVGAAHRGPARPHRGRRRPPQELRDGDGRPGARRRRRSRPGDRGRQLPRSAARSADRGQGPVLHARRPDDGSDAGPGGLRARLRRDRRGAARRRRGGAARQAEPDRRSDGRLPPRLRHPRQPVGRGTLAGRVVERLGRRHRGRPVLRVARIRHRRLHPASRRRSAASWGSSRPGVSSAATASSSSPARSTTSVR